jgi:mannan endo-1,4-beta-mannosidase
MRPLIIATIALQVLSCSSNPGPSPNEEQFSVRGNRIYNYSSPVQLIGTNALHVFGGSSNDMNSWNMNVAREFVGNMKESPLTGAAIQDANGAFLHSLQEIAANHRSNKRVTIFCPFGWDGTSATEFTGKRPSQMSFWKDYQARLAAWALLFKDQPDVWLEVWNEPYRFDRADGYTDDIWFSDMTEMVNVIRNAGNNNIVLVPCAEQGQDESVLLTRGTQFLTGKKNLLFDVHAYEKWLLVTNANMGGRLQQLRSATLPVIFGEVAPVNAGSLMDPKSFLDSIYANHFSVCAWVWKYDGSDQDALLDNNGQPNVTNNNSWGTLYREVALRTRKP